MNPISGASAALLLRTRRPITVRRGGSIATATPSSPVNRGYPPAPLGEAPPRSLADAAAQIWVRRVVDTVNNAQRGKINVTLDVTLAPNTTTTTIIDPRISAFSAILFCPTTANAAAELASGHLFVSARQSGQATLTHTDNAQTDRS